ncbi:uncharacterized protein LOC144577784 [Callithrix jacchus]
MCMHGTSEWGELTRGRNFRTLFLCPYKGLDNAVPALLQNMARPHLPPSCRDILSYRRDVSATTRSWGHFRSPQNEFVPALTQMTSFRTANTSHFNGDLWDGRSASVAPQNLRSLLPLKHLGCSAPTASEKGCHSGKQNREKTS